MTAWQIFTRLVAVGGGTAVAALLIGIAYRAVWAPPRCREPRRE